jgi:hypothetical protein
MNDGHVGILRVESSKCRQPYRPQKSALAAEARERERMAARRGWTWPRRSPALCRPRRPADAASRRIDSQNQLLRSGDAPGSREATEHRQVL